MFGSGAVRVSLDVALPALVIPISLLIASIGPTASLCVLLFVPLLLLTFSRCYVHSVQATSGINTRSRVFYAWGMASAFSLYIVYMTVVIGFREVLLWETMLLTTLYIAILMMLRRTRTDPGVIQKSTPIILKDGQTMTYCSECKVEQPPRSGHCPVCNVCVLIRDHHCVWIDCCIGAHNHRSFLITLFLAVITGYYGANLTMTTICTPEMYWDWFLLPSDCRFVYADFPTSICFVSACYTYIASTLLLLLLLYQSLLISQNVTMREASRAMASHRWYLCQLMFLLTNGDYSGGFMINWRDFIFQQRLVKYKPTPFASVA